MPLHQCIVLGAGSKLNANEGNGKELWLGLFDQNDQMNDMII